MSQIALPVLPEPPPALTQGGKIGIVMQGPIQTDINGRSTQDVLKALSQSPLRDRFFVTYAMWADEPEEKRDAVAPFLDRVILCQKPERPGSCHRNFQAHAVQQGLLELERNNIAWAFKTRSDVLLSERFLRLLLNRAETPGYNRIFVTNLFTRQEPFHVSDMLVFSSTTNLRDWFCPSPVYYEDLFSPEVQFARLFIRARKLAYPMTLAAYLQFLRDWVDLVDFYAEGLLWFKDGCGSTERWNRTKYVVYDRDAGPVQTRLVSIRFHQALLRKKNGFNLLATQMLVQDAIERYVYTMVPGFRRHHCYYTVDNKGTEHDKPVPQEFFALKEPVKAR